MIRKGWGFVRNFPHNFQTTARNKLMPKISNIASCSIVSAKHSSAFVDGVPSNSVGMKPLAVDHPLITPTPYPQTDPQGISRAHLPCRVWTRTESTSGTPPYWPKVGEGTQTGSRWGVAQGFMVGNRRISHACAYSISDYFYI